MGRRAAALVMAMLTLAGCASAPQSDTAVGRASPRAPSSPPWRPGPQGSLVGPCPSGSPARATRPQLRAFRAVSALRCEFVERSYADGQWQVRVEQVTREGVTAFAASLDRPDAAPTSGACPAVAIGEPTIVLVDRAGHRLIPRFPRDECGQPRAGLADTLRHWRTAGRPVRVRLELSRAELDHHCPPAYKNVIRLDDQYGPVRPDPGGPVLTRGDQGTLFACLFNTGPDPVAGAFVRGVTLHGRDAAAMRAALAAAGKAGRCVAPDAFATVTNPAGETVTVELGGCGRVERSRDDLAQRISYPTLGRADLPTVRRLLGA